MSLGLQSATLDEELAAVQKNKEAKVTAQTRWYNGVIFVVKIRD